MNDLTLVSVHHQPQAASAGHGQAVWDKPAHGWFVASRSFAIMSASESPCVRGPLL